MAKHPPAAVEAPLGKRLGTAPGGCAREQAAPVRAAVGSLGWAPAAQPGSCTALALRHPTLLLVISAAYTLFFFVVSIPFLHQNAKH